MSLRYEWRESVLNTFKAEYDRYKCIGCPMGETLCKSAATVHHVNPQSNSPERKFDSRNGIVVCEGLHRLFHEGNGLSVLGRILEVLLETQVSAQILDMWLTLHIPGECYKYSSPKPLRKEKKKGKKNKRV